ncbi:MAG: cytochrome c biogenesis protein CcsA [Chloroflexota bacterium]
MEKQPLALKLLTILSALGLALVTALVFFYAPLETVMGYVQKVFYFHVATAWVGMLGFVVAAVAGIVYLVKHDLKWDKVELAAVEISLVFFLIAIVLGSIWARPSWGTWWTWDPRLTTAAILEMIYIAYLLLRQGIEDPDRRARFGAVYTLVGGVSVPVTFLSIRLVRTIHPAVIGTASAASQGGFDMTPPMLTTFLLSLLVFTLIFATLLWHRIRLGRLQDMVEQLKMKILE